MAKRFLKKESDDSVFTYHDLLAKKKGIVEITEVEALWRIAGAKGTPPAVVGFKVSEVDPVILAGLAILSSAQIEQVKDFMENLTGGAALPVEEDIEIEDDVEEDDDEDEETEEDEEDEAKPIIMATLQKMNKSELDTYARINFKEFLDITQLTKAEMIVEIKRLEGEKATV